MTNKMPAKAAHGPDSKPSTKLQGWIQEALSDDSDSNPIGGFGSGETLHSSGVLIEPEPGARHRETASNNIKEWKRRLSKNPQLLERLLTDQPSYGEYFGKLYVWQTIADGVFDGDIIKACHEFGLDPPNAKHRNLLLGILCASYFPFLIRLGRHRGRGDAIEDQRLRTHALILDKIIKRRGLRSVMEACGMPRGAAVRQKISRERRAELLQKFWPEHYELVSIEVIAKHLSRIKKPD
jgi:hypothetical protein